MLKVLFIVNPISGQKAKDAVLKAVRKELDLSRFEYKVVHTEFAGHGTVIARNCDADIVVAVGGDGTVSEVAGGIAGTKKILGIIPCGSGDGLARHLGISRKPRTAVRQLNRAETVKMDFGTIEGRNFFCSAGVGMDANVALEFAKAGSRGLGTYVSKTISVWRHFVPGRYSICVDGDRRDITASFVTVANVNQWGNNAIIAPDASVYDGFFDVIILRPFGILDIPGLALSLFSKSFSRNRKVTALRGRRIDVHCERETVAHVDGDPVEIDADIHIEIHPSAFNVLVPEGHSYRI